MQQLLESAWQHTWRCLTSAQRSTWVFILRTVSMSTGHRYLGLHISATIVQAEAALYF